MISSLLKGLIMSETDGEKVIFILCEWTAGTWVYFSIERFLAGKTGTGFALAILAILFAVVGVKWPAIKLKLRSRFPNFPPAVERIASNRLYRRLIYSAIAIVLLLSIGISIYRHYRPPVTVAPVASQEADFKATILAMITMHDNNNVQNALIFLELTNNGFDSVATNFRLEVTSPSGESLVEYPAYIVGEMKAHTRAVGDPDFEFTQADNLVERAAVPIKRGDIRYGALFFLFPGLPEERVFRASDTWKISFLDYTKKQWDASMVYGAGTHSSTPPLPPGIGKAVTAQHGTYTIEPWSIDFGSVKLGEVSKIKVVTITSAGPGDVEFKWDETKSYLATFGLTGDFEFGYKGTCNTRFLNPHQKCTVSLRFVPKFQGPRDGELTMVLNGNNVVVHLSGTGVATPSSSQGKNKSKPTSTKPLTSQSPCTLQLNGEGSKAVGNVVEDGGLCANGKNTGAIGNTIKKSDGK